MIELSSLIKNLIKLFLYYLVEKFIWPNKIINEKTLLLIRMDAIGDYVLFQDYIQFIRKSEKYKDYRITLVGNDLWREFEELKMTSFIDEYIWINRKFFFRNLFYRLSILRRIASKGYEVIIQPTYSREYTVGDTIVKLTTATHKIGHEGDFGNSSIRQKNKSDKFYTKLFKGSPDIMYEFDRNKEFFENVLSQTFQKQALPKLPKYKQKKPLIDAKKYIVLFIGANSSYRCWGLQNYSLLAEHLRRSMKYSEHDIILCGSKAENEAAKWLTLNSSIPLINMVGRTSLTELTHIVDKADLLVTNETSAHHIGVATNCSLVIVLYAGNHFGRFVPIIPHNNKYKAILHPKILKDPEAYKTISNTIGYHSNLNIDDIKVPDVTRVISYI